MAGANLNFNNKGTGNETAAPTSSPVEEPVGLKDQEMNSTYVDKRSVTIALARVFNRDLVSFYRRANDKALVKRKDYIGSSITSSQILSSSKGEVEAYLPALLGVAANHDSFVTRVKQYFNNIQVGVDEIGKTLDTSFIYNKKSDYIRFQEAEDKIEAEYQAINRSNYKALREGLEKKITELNNLESLKYQYGRPQNISDYLLYRHCLLYKDVAKDVAFINDGPNIRFYFKDDKREAEKLKKFRNEVLKAKANYVTCMGDPDLFESVYIQYCVTMNIPVSSALLLPDIEKETRLDKFSTEDPVKFNKICANKDNKTIALIEKLIAHGELTRMEHNQNIITSDGQFIGSNMNEALAWFKNPEHNAEVTAYKNKLSNI